VLELRWEDEMQKWKYTVESCYVDYPDSGRVALLDEYGENGWELVSAVIVDGRWHWTFKRPMVLT
jgi:hypothetical protein